MEQAPVLIVKRSKGHKHQAHGGAWKVAYADFVTAMMALFIVLWLLSSSEQVKKTVGGYFSDPTGHGKDVGNGLRGAGGESLSVSKDDMSKIREKLAEAIKNTSPIQHLKDHVVMTVTTEGLRIELSEGDQNAFFFESGNALPTGFGKEILAKLATEIGKLPNKLVIEGHTDAKSFDGKRDYSNWELSSDRANAARRLMEESGVRTDQVAQVRGYADQKPRDHVAPDDASNRRVTVIIQNEAGPAKQSDADAANQTEPAKSSAAKPAASPTESAKPGQNKGQTPPGAPQPKKK